MTRHALPPATAGGRAIPTTTTAFVGPFGGVTAATMLRAIIEHPQRTGDPLALTVNFCAPIAPWGRSISTSRLIKANRSNAALVGRAHPGGTDVGHLRPGVRGAPSVMVAQPATFRKGRIRSGAPYPKSSLKMSWVAANMISAFVEANELAARRMPRRQAPLQIVDCDTAPRKIDVLSLMSMSDAFSGRIFHVRNAIRCVRTVSLTTYFHTDAEDLAAEDITHVLAIADAKIFHKSYGIACEFVVADRPLLAPRRRWRISRRRQTRTVIPGRAPSADPESRIGERWLDSGSPAQARVAPGMTVLIIPPRC